MTIKEEEAAPESAQQEDSTNDIRNCTTSEQHEDIESPEAAQEDSMIEPNAERKDADNDGDNYMPVYSGPILGSAEERKIKHWEDSHFAVGCVNVTWEDDHPSWWCCKSRNADGDITRSVDSRFAVSSIVCGCLGAGRVGNMAVLAQSTENYDEEIVDQNTGQVTVAHRKRPKLLWVVGPYWTVNLFVTFPLIFGVSGWICYQRIIESNLAVIITWSIGTFLMLFSLCMISCRNPGILYRHSEIPADADEEWKWNDQARTYRPPSARFDSECQVVIKGFDHTCPWTGTAIGSENMFWFKIFVCMVPIMIVYTVCLAAFGGLLSPFFSTGGA